jgi:hypothetical protein
MWVKEEQEAVPTDCCDPGDDESKNVSWLNDRVSSSWWTFKLINFLSSF